MSPFQGKLGFLPRLPATALAIRKDVNEVNGLEAVAVSPTALSGAPPFLSWAAHDAIGRQSSWYLPCTEVAAVVVHTGKPDFPLRGACPRAPPVPGPSLLQLMILAFVRNVIPAIRRPGAG